GEVAGVVVGNVQITAAVRRQTRGEISYLCGNAADLEKQPGVRKVQNVDGVIGALRCIQSAVAAKRQSVIKAIVRRQVVGIHDARKEVLWFGGDGGKRLPEPHVADNCEFAVG